MSYKQSPTLHATAYSSTDWGKRWVRLAIEANTTTTPKSGKGTSGVLSRLCQHSSFLVPLGVSNVLLDDSDHVQLLAESPDKQLDSWLPSCLDNRVHGVGDFGCISGKALILSVPRGSPTPDHKSLDLLVDRNSKQISKFDTVVIDGARALHVLMNSAVPSSFPRKISKSRNNSSLSNVVVIGEDMGSVRGSLGKLQ